MSKFFTPSASRQRTTVNYAEANLHHRSHSTHHFLAAHEPSSATGNGPSRKDRHVTSPRSSASKNNVTINMVMMPQDENSSIYNALAESQKMSSGRKKAVKKRKSLNDLKTEKEFETGNESKDENKLFVGGGKADEGGASSCANLNNSDKENQQRSKEQHEKSGAADTSSISKKLKSRQPSKDYKLMVKLNFKENNNKSERESSPEIRDEEEESMNDISNSTTSPGAEGNPKTKKRKPRGDRLDSLVDSLSHIYCTDNENRSHRLPAKLTDMLLATSSRASATSSSAGGKKRYRQTSSTATVSTASNNEDSEEHSLSPVLSPEEASSNYGNKKTSDISVVVGDGGGGGEVGGEMAKGEKVVSAVSKKIMRKKKIKLEIGEHDQGMAAMVAATMATVVSENDESDAISNDKM